ncbi:MAG TPA: cytochrome B6 [Cyanobacteria bacterium UBA8803]|nr:cytochrome B6 [Cyanobacteria bacterium UBA9273]HBL57071.1 cytochrome B6 [Cyanobacteria bacterium UBA8803]
MNRREFLTWVGVGGLASYLPVAIAACSPKATQSESPASPVRTDGFQPVGTVAELGQKGQILNKEFSGGAVLVVQNPANPKAVTAVNPSCTHEGCTVTWQADQKQFVCPCHDSKFTLDGKVTQGPAKTPLVTYEAKLEGNSVLVKAGKS